MRGALWKAAPVASALLSCISAARAADDDTAASTGLAEVVVTATKRAENLQDVPISVQAIGTKQLEQMNVTHFDDYVKMLPSVAFQSGGPSFEHTFMRGVAADAVVNHSGSEPTVGMYLDEQPVTTIDGNLNLHIYDIERVESLSGPQGTLYGSSSESGTIRIITNKPDLTGFKGGYNLEGNTVDHGGTGYNFEGFINIPLTSWAAVRLVGWDQKDAGYIDNVHGSVTFPTSGITFDNAKLVKKDYNDVETKGGRAALKIELNDNWTILPQVMGQVQDTNGNFAFNPKIGDLETTHYFPETVHDSWVQSALTIQGKISNFDLVYSGGYLTRNTHESQDYTDYSLFYDIAYGSGASFVDNNGNLINPAQYIIGRDHYTKTNHEFRVSSPTTWPVRFTAGFFIQRQVHEILQDYTVPGDGTPLGSVAPNDVSVPGWPGTIWLTDQERVDRDKAVFTELAYDITSALTLNAGIRYYTFDNTLKGFYGFNDTYSSHTGVAICGQPFVPFHGAPCTDLDARTTGSGNTPKINLQYKLDPDKMVYATWSKGFRPGGINRNGGGKLPPYKPDYLTNYEIGWKTSWMDKKLRWNGAFFWEDWKNFQFSYLGENALTIITNAGSARIKGVETNIDYLPMPGLTLSGGFTWLQAKLTQTFCGDPTICSAPDFDPSTYETYAPKDTQLPIVPKFKGNLTARYEFPIVGDMMGYAQASELYVSKRTVDLRTLAEQQFGAMPAYAITDLNVGFTMKGVTGEVYVSNAFDRRAILNRFAECDALVCGNLGVYDVPNQPRTIGVRFGQKF
jgi:outer membrane receptor protein involved in Fe transport